MGLVPNLDLSACAVSGAANDPLVQRAHPAPERWMRTPFQRDRERIVQSRAFRRLAGKTQVFTRRESDHFRSRLTHTIEVVQIARSIATALQLNVELAEVLALVHDIGHPPFGHAGERALDECLRPHGLKFDHNLHALRIVEFFEQRYISHRGLNLTLGVREGIIKHSRDYSAADQPELRQYFLDQRPPLEAQLIDLADEIAYLTADLDDGVESGLIEIAHIREQVGLVRRCYDKLAAQYPGAEAKYLFHEALYLMQHALVEDLIRNTARNVEGIAAKSLEDIRTAKERLAVLSPEIEAERAEGKSYLYEALYTSGPQASEHRRAERVVKGLFDFWIANPDKLPQSYIDEVPKEGLARTIADYIAGMTDSFIFEQYALLLG